MTKLFSSINEQPNAKTFLWLMFLYSSCIILHFPERDFPRFFQHKQYHTVFNDLKLNEFKFHNMKFNWPKDRSSHHFDIILIEKHKSVEILHSSDDISLHVNAAFITCYVADWAVWLFSSDGMKWNIKKSVLHKLDLRQFMFVLKATKFRSTSLLLH